jgi:hypothetical protein
MSQTATHIEAEQEQPGGLHAAAASQDVPFSHLHFDRRARTWRGSIQDLREAIRRDEEQGTGELRCA